MKANRKFLNRDEEAVSPVIAVILMVAITVVLAATVYVWVSGFGSGGGNTPAHTMALTSGGAIDQSSAASPDDDFYKPYTVASADPSLTWGDLKVTFGGAEIAFDPSGDCDNGDDVAADAAPAASATEWTSCSGTSETTADDLVSAGDKIYIVSEATPGSPSGTELIFLDTQANSVMLTLTMR